MSAAAAWGADLGEPGRRPSGLRPAGAWIPEDRRPPESTESYAALMRREAERQRPLYVQGALAVDFDDDDEVWASPRQTRRTDLPEPQEWAARMALAVMEVLRGTRSLPQLMRWTSPDVYAAIGAQVMAAGAGRADLRTRRRAPVRIRRVRVCEPADGVAEAAVVLLDGTRTRAMALRLVGLDGRWRIEALTLA